MRGATDWSYLVICLYSDFNPRAPCGARRAGGQHRHQGLQISTHAPLAGRDCNSSRSCLTSSISTHAPLAGRDRSLRGKAKTNRISTHAPLAGRDDNSDNECATGTKFQPTRPLRGATKYLWHLSRTEQEFQPTRPLRGATFSGLFISSTEAISTHAPLAGRDEVVVESSS